jgi:hypothetical protein
MEYNMLEIGKPDVQPDKCYHKFVLCPESGYNLCQNLYTI